MQGMIPAHHTSDEDPQRLLPPRQPPTPPRLAQRRPKQPEPHTFSLNRPGLHNPPFCRFT
jgi:hypothetical protein